MCSSPPDRWSSRAAVATPPSSLVPPQTAVRRTARCCALINFIFFGSYAAFYPYIFVWMKDNGYGANERAMLFSCYQVPNIVAGICWGTLADASGRHIPIFWFVTLIGSAAVALLTAFPQIAAVQALGLFLAGACDNFGLLEAFMVRSLTWSGIPEMVPKSRMIASLAWSGLAPLFGVVARSYGVQWLFRAYSISMIALLPICSMLPITQAYRDGSTLPESGRSSVEEGLATRMGAVLRRAKVYLLLFVFIGINDGITYTFAFIYLESELHYTGFQLGLTLSCHALVELPLWGVGSAIVARLGNRESLLTALIATAGRYLAYCVLTSAWQVLPFESLHSWVIVMQFTVKALVAEKASALGLQASLIGSLNLCRQAGSLLSVIALPPLQAAFGTRSSLLLVASVFAAVSLPPMVYLLCGARGRDARSSREEQLMPANPGPLSPLRKSAVSPGLTPSTGAFLPASPTPMPLSSPAYSGNSGPQQTRPEGFVL